MAISPADLYLWSKSVAAAAIANEVQFRACVSRAYYAALHASRASFKVKSGTNIQSSHQGLIDELVLRSKAPGQGRSQAAIVAKHLPKLKRLRVQSDYELESTPTAHDVARALQTAEQILVACNEAERLMACVSTSSAAQSHSA